MFKKAVSGYDFVELAVVDRILTNYEENSFLIGHNRAATRGSVSARNAHPFEHGHITGVHNGTLVTHKALVEGTDPNYAVDSEYIFRGLEQVGSADLIPQINGAYCMLWYNSAEDKVHMIRNSDRPYYFAKIKKRNLLFGASEMGMLQWILTRNNLTIEDVIVPAPMTEYIFDMDGFMTPEEVEHEEYKYVTPIERTSNQVPGSSRSIQRIPRNIEFQAIDWTPYGDSLPDRGKWSARSVAGEDVVIYQSTEHEMIKDKWYVGLTRTMRTEYATYAVDVDTVKLVAADGPNGAVGGEMYRCVSCKEYFPEDELMFCTDSPLCGDCIDHYDTKPEGGTRICH